MQSIFWFSLITSNCFSYKNKIDEIADALEDEPMTSLETVVFWTEYVIRHKGAPFLKDTTLDLPVYILCFYDIIAVVLVVLGLVLYAFYKILKYVQRKTQSVHKKTL